MARSSSTDTPFLLTVNTPVVVTPTASTTYVLVNGDGLSTVPLAGAIPIPTRCTVRTALWFVTATTPASDGQPLHYVVRRAVRGDVTMSSGAAISYARTSMEGVESLLMVFEPGDMLQLRVVTPAWTTPPVGVRVAVTLAMTSP